MAIQQVSHVTENDSSSCSRYHSWLDTVLLIRVFSVINVMEEKPSRVLNPAR